MMQHGLSRRRRLVCNAIPCLALFLAAPALSQAPEAALHHAAAQAKTALEESRATVLPEQVPFPGGAVSGYDPGQVGLALETAKKDLLAGLQGDDLAGLRAWVEESYPNSGEELRLIHLRGETLATTDSTAGLFEKASGLLAHLKKIESLRIQLKLAVTPGEALVELWPAALPARKRSYRADATPEITVGLYEYRVAKEGFWDAHGKIDLVTETGSTLDCKLYPRTGSDRGLPCDLR